MTSVHFQLITGKEVLRENEKTDSYQGRVEHMLDVGVLQVAIRAKVYLAKTAGGVSVTRPRFLKKYQTINSKGEGYVD